MERRRSDRFDVWDIAAELEVRTSATVTAASAAGLRLSLPHALATGSEVGVEVTPHAPEGRRAQVRECRQGADATVEAVLETTDAELCRLSPGTTVTVRVRRPCTVKTISFHGALVHAADDVVAGSLAVVDLSVAETSLRAPVRVASVRPTGEGFLLGLAFIRSAGTDLAPLDDLLALLAGTGLEPDTRSRIP